MTLPHRPLSGLGALPSPNSTGSFPPVLLGATGQGLPEQHVPPGTGSVSLPEIFPAVLWKETGNCFQGRG